MGKKRHLLPAFILALSSLPAATSADQGHNGLLNRLGVGGTTDQQDVPQLQIIPLPEAPAEPQPPIEPAVYRYTLPVDAECDPYRSAACFPNFKKTMWI